MTNQFRHKILVTALAMLLILLVTAVAAAGPDVNPPLGQDDVISEPEALLAHDGLKALTPRLVGNSGSWLAIQARYRGDDNGNSYTIFEVSENPTGPWTLGCENGVPGFPEWRYCRLVDLTPDTDYYVQLTFVDPDGVVGTNPSVWGPIHTIASPFDALKVRTPQVTVQDTHILVTQPIAHDANRDGGMTVDIGTSPTGPWTEKCGDYNVLNPKLCRIHSLTPGTDYYVQITVSDPDGVVGTNPNVLGPYHYDGLENLAFDKSISADPGWGCCSDPAELIDGRIQYPDWTHGFAWTGGTGNWGGGSPGWKQATIDLGSVQMVDRVESWTHNTGGTPLDWKIEVSTDGVTFSEVFYSSEPLCRTATETLEVSWRNPTCSHNATFAPVDAQFVRYSFDDTALFDGIHGWASELEVFGP